MTISFLKMHGLGNDFVVIDGRKAAPALDSARIRRIAARQTGVGCDQLIVLEPARNGADAFMRIYNPDGSEAGACGNATRCVAAEIMKEKGGKLAALETVAGRLDVLDAGNGQYTADMGPPRVLPHELELTVGPLSAPAGVDMGNPHAVFFVPDVAAVDLPKWGPVIETDKLFPQKTNVEIVQVISKSELRMRVWERGAGITLACGSGACAVLVAAVHRGLTGRKAKVVMDGGALEIEWRQSDGHVLMTGPVTKVYKGEWLDDS